MSGQKRAKNSQLLSKYFDIKDNFDSAIENYENLRENYKVSFHNPPTLIKRMEEQLNPEFFNMLTGLEKPEEIEEQMEVLDKMYGEVEDFNQTLETLEIKLKNYFNRKNLLSMDPEVLELNAAVKMLKDPSKRTALAREDDILLDHEEYNEAVAKCEKDIESCSNLLAETLNRFKGIEASTYIRKKVESELFFLTSSKGDDNFLENVEINQTKIEKMQENLSILQHKERALKSKLRKIGINEIDPAEAKKLLAKSAKEPKEEPPVVTITRARSLPLKSKPILDRLIETSKGKTLTKVLLLKQEKVVFSRERLNIATQDFNVERSEIVKAFMTGMSSIGKKVPTEEEIDEKVLAISSEAERKVIEAALKSNKEKAQGEAARKAEFEFKTLAEQTRAKASMCLAELLELEQKLEAEAAA